MVMRIGGLASGMDIDDLVSKMMLQHKAPVTKLTQQKQQLEWKRQDLRDINRMILDFRNNTVFNFNMSSTFNQKTAKVSGNTNAVSATAKGDALEGSFSVNVQKLATAANRQTDIAGGVEGSTTLGTAGTTYSFTINDVEFEMDGSTTINEFIQQINKNADAKVSAFLDRNSGQIAFQNKETGFKDITFGGGIFEDGGLLQLKEYDVDTNKGSDAIVTINGMTIEQASNTFEINGTSITAHEVGSATVTTKIDADAIVDSVKNFVGKYNELLSTISGKLNETRHRNFLPLTDEQRKQFKDEGHDVDEWTSKAKSGLLRNDTTLERLLMDMRLTVASSIEGVGGGVNAIDSLAAIGITQEKYVKGSEKNGNLVIDEAKLRAAIERDPDGVMNLFNQREVKDEDGQIVQSNGIGEKLYKNLKSALDNITNTAGNPNANNEVTSLLSKQIVDLGLNIDNQNKRLVKIEANLYKRFAAMETAISRYAAQSAYLMSAFGGGPQG